MKFKKRELTDLENRLIAIATIPTSLGIYYILLFESYIFIKFLFA